MADTVHALVGMPGAGCASAKMGGVAEQAVSCHVWLNVAAAGGGTDAGRA